MQREKGLNPRWLALEMEAGAMRQGMGRPRAAGKGKEMDSP